MEDIMAIFTVASASASAPKTLNPSLDPIPGIRLRSLCLRSSLLLPPPLLPPGRRLRCSAQYGEAAAPRPGTAAPTTTTPRPGEVPWSRDLCNSVRLIGTVGTDVELRQLPSGAASPSGSRPPRPLGYVN